MKRYLRSFTLIEILLAMTIFSLIGLSLYGTFQSGIAINRRSEAIDQVTRESSWALDQLTRDLENMTGYDFSNSYPKLSACDGRANKITLILPVHDRLKAVTYFLTSPGNSFIYQTIMGRHTLKNVALTNRVQQEGRLNLFVREETDFVDYLQSSETKKTQRDVLSARVIEGSLKFSYGYLQGEGPSASILWKDSWKGQYIPSRVRVEVAFRGSGKDEKPVIFKKDLFIPTGFLGAEDH